MIRRTGFTFFLLLGFSLAVTVTGCGYSSSLPYANVPTVTPTGNIQHIVVIFQENVSFDHYFGTYPHALNLPGESPFSALPGTPAVDGLSQSLMLDNPNSRNPRNGKGATNPFRLSPASAATADQDHGYSAEQLAFDGGAMDLFPFSVGIADSPKPGEGITAHYGPDDGLLRRQHGNRAVELCTALCHERSLLRHYIWAVEPGGDQSSLRSDERRRR